MAGPTILFASDLSAPMTLDWEQTYAPLAAAFSNSKEGLIWSESTTPYTAKGWRSLLTFPRLGTIGLFRFPVSDVGRQAILFGLGDHFGAAAPSTVTGTTLINVLANLTAVSWNAPSSTPQESRSIMTPINRRIAWLALRLNAVGATIRFRLDGGAWTDALNTVGIGATDPVRVIVQNPYNSGLGYLHGVIVERSDGDITDAKLDSIIDASGLNGAYRLTPVEGQPEAALFHQGVAQTVLVHLTDSQGKGVPGVAFSAPLVWLVKNGVAASKTLSGPDWTAVDAVNLPGRYALQLSAADLNTPGELFVVVNPPGGAGFRPVEVRGFVQPTPTDYAPRFDAVDSAVALVDGKADAIQTDTGALLTGQAALQSTANAVAADAALTRKYQTNRVVVSGTGLATLEDDDNTPLHSQQLRDGAGQPLAVPFTALRERDKAVEV